MKLVDEQTQKQPSRVAKNARSSFDYYMKFRIALCTAVAVLLLAAVNLSEGLLVVLAASLCCIVVILYLCAKHLPAPIEEIRCLISATLIYLPLAVSPTIFILYALLRQTAGSTIVCGAAVVATFIGSVSARRTLFLLLLGTASFNAMSKAAYPFPVLAEDAMCVVLCIAYGALLEVCPEETGSAESPWFQRLVAKYTVPDMVRYFNYRVIADGGHKIMSESGGQYILGFHPHGISAANRVWDQLSPQWKNAVGCAHRYTFHAADAVFRIPLVRDLFIACGCRRVARTAILQSIRQGNSVMLIPGGQAEMALSIARANTLRLVSYHKGFVRIAIQEQLPLVPVFCFGEQDIQDNLHFERIQRYTAKKFGIALPFLPIGRFYLPLPCRVKQTVVVGAPIPVPPLSEALARDDAPITTPSRHTAKSKGRVWQSGPGDLGRSCEPRRENVL